MFTLKRRLLAVTVLATACVLAATYGGIFDNSTPQARALAKEPVATSCLVSGRMEVEASPADPYRVGAVTVGHGCELTYSERSLSAKEFAELAGEDTGTGRAEATEPAANLGQDQGNQDSLLAEYTHRTRATVRAEHAQIMMAQIKSDLTWSYDGWYVTSYSNGLADPDTGGCGWYVSDGAYAWWETGEMPLRIYMYGWAYFDTSCSPTHGGWMEAAAWGNWFGSHGAVCDYSISVPIGSVIQCFPTLLW